MNHHKSSHNKSPHNYQTNPSRKIRRKKIPTLPVQFAKFSRLTNYFIHFPSTYLQFKKKKKNENIVCIKISIIMAIEFFLGFLLLPPFLFLQFRHVCVSYLSRITITKKIFNCEICIQLNHLWFREKSIFNWIQ